VRPGNIDRFDVFVPVTCMIELNLKTEKFLLSGRFPPYIYLLLSPHPCDEHIRVVVFSSPMDSFSSPPSSAPPGLNKSGSSTLPVRQNDPFFEAILYNSHSWMFFHSSVGVVVLSQAVLKHSRVISRHPAAEYRRFYSVP
jgi:hypothetical protein